MHFWTSVFVPVFLGSIAIAFMATFQRYCLRDQKSSALQLLIVWYAQAALLFGLIYITSWGFTMPKALLAGFWTAVLSGTTANFFIQLFNAKAASIDAGEASFTKPLQAMTPGLIMILGTVLGEFPSSIGIFGIFFLMFSSWILLSTKNKDGKYEYFGPIKSLVKLRYLPKLASRWIGMAPPEQSPEEEKELRKAQVVLLAFGSACMGTIGLLFDGLYTRRGVDMQGLTLAAFTMVASLSIAYSIWYILRPDANEEQRKEGFSLLFKRKYVWALGIMSLCWVLHVFLIQPTFNETYVAYTGTLKRMGIVLTVVLGYVFLNEKDFSRRALSVCVASIGVFFISRDKMAERISRKLEKFVENLIIAQVH